MIWRVWTAYSVEVTKAARLKRTYLGPLLILVLIGCATLGHPVSRDGVSDYAFIAYVNPVALGFLGFLTVLVYCGVLVSAELSSGSIRLALLRPIHRHEYIAAKVLIAFSYVILTVLAAVVGSWGLVFALGDLSGVSYGGELLYTRESMMIAYGVGISLALVPQLAGAAFAVMVSTLTRSMVGALLFVSGAWVLVDMVKYPLGIERFVFTTYLEAPLQVFASRCDAVEVPWFPMTWYCLGTSVPVIIVSGAVAMFALHRRNLS